MAAYLVASAGDFTHELRFELGYPTKMKKVALAPTRSNSSRTRRVLPQLAEGTGARLQV